MKKKYKKLRKKSLVLKVKMKSVAVMDWKEISPTVKENAQEQSFVNYLGLKISKKNIQN